MQKEVGRIVHIYVTKGTGIPTELINMLARPTLFGLRETSLLRFLLFGLNKITSFFVVKNSFNTPHFSSANAKIDELQGIAKRKNAFLWDQKKNNTLTEFFPCLNS